MQSEPQLKRRKQTGAKALARMLVAAKSKHGVKRKDAVAEAAGTITSVATERNERGCVTRFIKWLRRVRRKDWPDATAMDAAHYLEQRSHDVKQKTLDGDRVAIQRVLNTQLAFVQSKVPTILMPRALSEFQVEALIEAADVELGLAIRIANFSGVRVHELFTLVPLESRPESVREWSRDRFVGIPEYVRFCVVGKGGLHRQVVLPPDLAAEVLTRRLKVPRKIRDREIFYDQHYELIGGKKVSELYTILSNEVLGFSTGFHGLRHSFAQRRMLVLQLAGFNWNQSLQIVAHELGHFSTSNVLKYVR